ncbi:N-acetylglucosaminyl-phosphatidylinositol de-N-acetylase isoform X2 [Durio zibethinus]|uniref:N-acetylglucosaminylphosphatidylinositol deacetylase n=1 Tax=Durio zibethinus TaxID=66656 RepID=A0A6P5YN39_DURZI|nr:N-acetylglucosaminyl-phosphatidylinositol de-N-acetylase isoform X2 [Durio zibethinus]
MGWMLIIISIFVVWVASLCKIFSSHSKPTFLNDGPAFHRRNVLLVVAHPDDESMFFSPTISYLTSRGHNLYLLCLSVEEMPLSFLLFSLMVVNPFSFAKWEFFWYYHGLSVQPPSMSCQKGKEYGNADGMGSIRKDELYLACAVHKVQLQRVKVLDHPDLQLITFDSYGVSGHCNHGDVHYGVRKFLHDSSPRNIEAWELVSINILLKYSGPLDIWLSTLDSTRHPKGVMHCLLNEHPRKSFLAMAQHSSQWVWFRKLFVSFSSYTYVNTLRKIK